MQALHEQVATIETRQDLAAFIERLGADAERAGAEWENPELPRFLEAVSAWTQDMDGYFRNLGEPVPEQPSWRLIGEMLLAAKYYE